MRAKEVSSALKKKGGRFLLRAATYFILTVFVFVFVYPFLTMLLNSFKYDFELRDLTKQWVLTRLNFQNYSDAAKHLNYMHSLLNTLLVVVGSTAGHILSCSFIAYGFARFNFRGKTVMFMLVILTMIVPHQTLQLSMFMQFRYFDIWGILSLLSGHASTGIASLDAALANIHVLPMKDAGITLTNTYWPLVILSMTGLAFKNGLYIFMLRQFFNGVPDALEESAYIDGSGTFRTFLTIILPLSIPMMVTVFLFAFCWQWTDDFYTEMFFTSSKIVLMPDIVDIPSSLKTDYAGQNMYYAAIRNTCGLCIILPLVILYAFCQNFLVQGIERSGLTAE